LCQGFANTRRIVTKYFRVVHKFFIVLTQRRLRKNRFEDARSLEWRGTKTGNRCRRWTGNTRSSTRMWAGVRWRSATPRTGTPAGTLAKPSTITVGCARWRLSKWWSTVGSWKRNGDFKGIYVSVYRFFRFSTSPKIIVPSYFAYVCFKTLTDYGGINEKHNSKSVFPVPAVRRLDIGESEFVFKIRIHQRLRGIAFIFRFICVLRTRMYSRACT